MATPYKEGDVFAVPLRTGGYAIGVIARVSADKSGGLLGYFYEKKFESVPSMDSIGSLNPDKAVRVLKFGDLSLLKKEWPVIGSVPRWERKNWPLPAFVRKDDLSKKAWRIHYSDDNIHEVIGEYPEPFDSSLERDALFGAGAIELLLTKLAHR